MALCLSMGCGGGNGQATNITVFAAASLTDAFSEIADEFELNNPGVDVKLNFAGSQRLRSQLELGARADVFASADEEQMRLASEADLITGDSQYFASSSMSVIVSAQSSITSLDQLGKDGVRVVLAHDSVPAGAYSRQLLHRLSSDDAGLDHGFAERVMANVVSEETSVKVVEQKVVLGEADAGIVYRPGMLSALESGSVKELPLPAAAGSVRAFYPIAALMHTEKPALAAEFIDLVLSDSGRRILASHGFDAP